MRPRLVYVVTHPVTADLLLRGQLGYMRSAGFDVTLVSSPGADLATVADREGVPAIAVPMTREPSRHDATSLVELGRALRRLSPDIVHASTPKAGLLGMLAARALRCRARIYLLRGLRLETARGPLRQVLSATERIASTCATSVPCVSESLLRVAVDGGYVPRRKAHVIGPGSSNGVDAARFHPTPERLTTGWELVGRHGVERGDFVIGFVGRLVGDKGIAELLDAFAVVRSEVPRARLLLVGDGLAGDGLSTALADRIRCTPRAHAVGAVRDLAPYYATFDVLAFPSHREGFPNVPLEAGAAGVPTVGYRATGVVDAVDDGVTGLLCPRGDWHALARAVLLYARDGDLRRAHGAAARARATTRFAQASIWAEWRRFFEGTLNAPLAPAVEAQATRVAS